MNAKEFEKKISKAAENAGTERTAEEKKRDVLETVNVIRDFGQEFVNELCTVLTGKVTSQTCLIIADIMKAVAESIVIDNKPGEEGKAIFTAYKVSISTAKTTIQIPVITEEDEDE